MLSDADDMPGCVEAKDLPEEPGWVKANQPEEPGWVKAKDVLTSFSSVRSFVSGDGLPRVEADYRYCARERRVRGLVRFGVGAEGMPGFVHGGAISGVFDEGVGLLSWYLGVPVATRELIVRYREFIPIGSVVTIDGQLAPPEDFMVRGSAVLRGHDGTVHATAQATFVELDPNLVAELAERNSGRKLPMDDAAMRPDIVSDR